MAFSSGTFTLVAGNPVVTGTTISSTWANNTLSDLATGLSTCILKDGTQTLTADIPFGGYKITNAVAVIIGGSALIGNENLSSQKNANQANAYFQNTSATMTGYMHAYNMTAVAGGTTWKFIEGDNSGGICLNIFGNGNITNTNNSYGAISDAKIKDLEGLANSQWEDVKALGKLVSKFTLKADPDKRVQIGWIAQDVQRVSPGLVFSTPDYETRRVVINGVPQFNKKRVELEGVATEIDDPASPMMENFDLGTVTLGVHYSVAYMKAFKALAEALERIEALEAKVGA